MRALGFMLAVTACGGNANAHPHHPHENDSIHEDEIDADDDETTPSRHRHSNRDDDDDDEPRPPARAIAMIAATDDGRSAVSTDSIGHVKLWPTIDGKPIDLDLPTPRMLAIAPSKRGFEVVEVDDAGGLVIADVDANGKTHAHTSITNDPAFVGIEMTAAGALAWCADHTIVVVGSDGKIASRIAAPVGDRVIDVATSGTHALVLLQTPTMRRLRQLELGSKLAWGAWIDGEGVLAATTIALSPNGQRLAMIIGSDKRPRLQAIDVATGKVLVDVLAGRNVRAIAFPDANHAVVVRARDVGWIDLGVEHPDLHNARQESQPGTNAPSAVGGGHLIMATRRKLYVAPPP